VVAVLDKMSAAAAGAASTTKSIIIDNREHQLITLLSDATVQQLPIGDIWISIGDCSQGGIVLERKTVRDFEASILDGRFREQKARLLAFCQERSAIPMYIIEGPWMSTSGAITSMALMKLAARIQCKHGIAVMQTADTKETAALIVALDEYYRADPTNLAKADGPIRAIDTIHVVKKSNAADPKHFAIACLAQCPGISAKLAESIFNEFGSLAGVFAASAEEIAGVGGGAGAKRKVGKVVGERLWNLLHSGE
jgi:ERCC4-type nuclease